MRLSIKTFQKSRAMDQRSSLSVVVSRGVAVVDFDLIVASFFLPGGWCVIFAINIGM